MDVNTLHKWSESSSFPYSSWSASECQGTCFNSDKQLFYKSSVSFFFLLFFGSHITRITRQQVNVKCHTYGSLLKAMIERRKHAGMQSQSKVLAATQRERLQGLGLRVSKGDLQPLICIVNITIAKVFPSEAMTGHRSKGNRLDWAGWRIIERRGENNKGRGSQLDVFGVENLSAVQS